MPYYLTVSQNFEAAHYLSGYSGNCANIHGHTWKVEVTIVGSQLDSIGMLVDFRDIRRELAAVLVQFDHALITKLLLLIRSTLPQKIWLSSSTSI